MSVSPHAFRVALCQEHLEEASALYEQCAALRGDPEIPWVRLRDFEDRLDAHLEALVAGGAVALDLCRIRAQAGDPGELFAAASVFCRTRDAASLARVWQMLDFADDGKVQALSDALKLELPDAWLPACQQALAAGDPRLVPIIAAAGGYRRVAVGEAIARRVMAAPEGVAPATVWALSRLPAGATEIEALQLCYQHPEPQIKAAALSGLLHAGDHRALQSAYRAAPTESWPHVAMGVAGDRAAATILRRVLDAGGATPDTVRALAMLGDVSSVRSLCAALPSDEIGATAAFALYWITGAPLFESAFVPEAVEESTLFPDELAAWRARGDAPRRADGGLYGGAVRQLTREPATWNQWLADNASRFDPGVRYRKGQPYSPRVVFECLLDPAAPTSLRYLSAEELAVRFDCRGTFEADLPVARQQVALRQMAVWIQDNEARLAVGAGTFSLGRI